MELEVEIPPGSYPGSDLVVSTLDNRELIVTIPDGKGPGDMLLVTVPITEFHDGSCTPTGSIGALQSSQVPSCSKVEVTIPDGCFTGMEFTVELNGLCFGVVVPEGCGPGVLLQVDVPQENPTPTSPTYSQQPEILPPMSPTNMPIGTPQALADAAAHARLQSLQLSDSSEDERGPKFAVGAGVEVKQTDGNWSMATVTSYNEAGRNYNVKVADGPIQCYVKESNLRIPRAFLLK